MLLIGSVAMLARGLTNRKPKDTDLILTYEEYVKLTKLSDVVYHYPLNGKKFVIKKRCGEIIECEIAWEGSCAEKLLNIVQHNNKLCRSYEGNMHIAGPEVQLTLKLSHRYLRNSPHFHKTMADIRTLRGEGYSVPEELQDWLKEREAETYNYSHPKLRQKKDEFFDTNIGVEYKYDHDSIHTAVALGSRPAYMEFKPEDEDVWCSKEMWDNCTVDTKLAAVYEECCVLALERCLVPFGFKTPPEIAFKMALEKVCTSITSGWFREFAWEYYDLVMGVLRGDKMLYVDAFNSGLRDGTVKEVQ